MRHMFVFDGNCRGCLYVYHDADVSLRRIKVQYLLSKSEYDELQCIIAYLVDKQGGKVDVPTWVVQPLGKLKTEKLWSPTTGETTVRVTVGRED